MTERQRMQTEQQQRLLTYIVDYKRQYNGNSPSYREMMEHMGMVNTSKLVTVLQALVKQQKIVVAPGMARGIIVPGTAWGYVEEEQHAVLSA